MLLELAGGMKTNAPHRASTPPSDHNSGAAPERPRGIVACALALLQQGLCGLHGHDALLQYERNRIYLRCTSCGYESPGWEVARAAVPVRRRAGAELVVARKVA